MKKSIILILLLTFISNLYGQENCLRAREKYFELYPDVDKRIDPWIHYNNYGKKQGKVWPSCNDNSTKNSSSTNFPNTFKLKKIEIQNPNNNRWDEIVLIAPLQIFIDKDKNITFNDYHMTFMELLAGKNYVGQYNSLIFLNSGLDKSDSAKSIDGYYGKLKLIGGINFPQSKNAYVNFMYYPNTKKLGIIEISNYFCQCHVRFYL